MKKFTTAAFAAFIALALSMPAWSQATPPAPATKTGKADTKDTKKDASKDGKDAKKNSKKKDKKKKDAAPTK